MGGPGSTCRATSPTSLQSSEAIGHHAIGKARDGTFEFAEAGWPLQQEKQKLEHPPLGQHLQLSREVPGQLKRGLVPITLLRATAPPHRLC
jgi:hypothetical protein